MAPSAIAEVLVAKKLGHKLAVRSHVLLHGHHAQLEELTTTDDAIIIPTLTKCFSPLIVQQTTPSD